MTKLDVSPYIGPALEGLKPDEQLNLVANTGKHLEQHIACPLDKFIGCLLWNQSLIYAKSQLFITVIKIFYKYL